MKKKMFAVSLLLLFLSIPALSNSVIPVEDFFRNPEKTSFELSPDGKYFSFLKPWK